MPSTQLEIIEWLTEAALAGAKRRDMLAGVCEKLNAGGMDLSRAAISQPTLHPIFSGYLQVWRRGGGVSDEGWSLSPTEAAFARMPFALMTRTDMPEVRERLDREIGPSRFPMVEAMRVEGVTDYFARMIRLGDNAAVGPANRIIFSWATERRGGLSDAETELLRGLAPTLALAFNRNALRDAFETVIETYLGRAAGRRILNGTVRRGDGASLRAALWYCDLRGFTKISDREPRDRLIALLHDYFGVMVDSVHAHGGDVLKFTGDGFLATFFDVGGDQENCKAALDAAQDCLAALGALGASRAGDGLPIAGIGLGLHLGDVAFGNVGSTERLDFTVVGAAVNETARIEAMSRALDQEVVISQTFAAALDGACGGRLVSLGRYALRGVSRPQELFTLVPAELAVA